MTLANTWLGSIILTPVTGNQNLASGSMNLASVVYSVPAVLDRVAVKIGAACTENLTISLSPYVGTAYSTVMYAANTSGQTSIFWQPTRPLYLYPGDVVNLNVTNTGLSGQVYGYLLTLA